MQLVCLLTSVGNKTRLIIRKILLSQSLLQFSGGERGVDLSKLIKSLLVSAESILFGYSVW